jgi:mitogen-activated protein kinase 1/3
LLFTLGGLQRNTALSDCRQTSGCESAQVAIKRIPDVLASPDQAKRVLREVAILRRLAHPNVISLRDAFTRPSATGTPQQS